MITKNGHIINEVPNCIAGHLSFSKSLAREFREAIRSFDARKKHELDEKEHEMKAINQSVQSNPNHTIPYEL